MSVYVDKAKNQYGRMFMCHMVADTLDELHNMADQIGIKRRWFQNSGSMPHYDICQAKKQEAIRLGAKEIESIELVALMRQWRERKDCSR
jgi:hypothetical protein